MKLKNIIANNGATIGKKDEISFTSGYQVSKKDLSVIPTYKLRKKDLLAILETLKTREYLGVWIDNNKAYIDISEHRLSLDQALSLGKKRNQISIFDWSTKDCIYC